MPIDVHINHFLNNNVVIKPSTYIVMFLYAYGYIIWTEFFCLVYVIYLPDI